MKQFIVAPSILAADHLNLASSAATVLKSTNWLHVDVMDGHFVPNLSFGPQVVKSLRKQFSSAYLDCHLMVTKPEDWIEVFASNGASGFTFHLEATNEWVKLAERVKATGMKCGVSIKPSTNITEYQSVLKELCSKNLLDLVLVMTVEPGFGGQKFINDESTVGKLQKLNELFQQEIFDGRLIIEVDGGLNLETINICMEAG